MPHTTRNPVSSSTARLPRLKRLLQPENFGTAPLKIAARPSSSQVTARFIVSFFFACSTNVTAIIPSPARITQTFIIVAVLIVSSLPSVSALLPSEIPDRTGAFLSRA